jgi:hypothetical protein
LHRVPVPLAPGHAPAHQRDAKKHAQLSLIIRTIASDITVCEDAAGKDFLARLAASGTSRCSGVSSVFASPYQPAGNNQRHQSPIKISEEA